MKDPASLSVVVDTNVLVTGLLSPFGASGEITRMISSGRLSLCFDARIMSEYRQVLMRPEFSLDPGHVGALFDQIRKDGRVVSSEPLRVRLPDHDDEIFLEAALSGEAVFLVTQNLRHFPASRRQGIRVVSPSEFLAHYRRRLAGS